MIPKLSKMSREPAFLFVHGKEEHGLRCREVGGNGAEGGNTAARHCHSDRACLRLAGLALHRIDSGYACSNGERKMQRLLYEHDAKYFATNLSPKGLPGYPPNHQKYVIASLTKLVSRPRRLSWLARSHMVPMRAPRIQRHTLLLMSSIPRMRISTSTSRAGMVSGRSTFSPLDGRTNPHRVRRHRYDSG